MLWPCPDRRCVFGYKYKNICLVAGWPAGMAGWLGAPVSDMLSEVRGTL